MRAYDCRVDDGAFVVVVVELNGKRGKQEFQMPAFAQLPNRL